MSENCLKSLQAQANKSHVDPIIAIRQERVQKYKDKVAELQEVNHKIRNDAQEMQQEFSEEQTEMTAKYHKDFVPEFQEVRSISAVSMGRWTDRPCIAAIYSS